MVAYSADDPILIQAAEESGLADQYRNDPALLRIYMRKLLIFGWSGDKTPTEKEYVKLARRGLGKGPSEAQLAAISRLNAQRKVAGTAQPSNTSRATSCTAITRSQTQVQQNPGSDTAHAQDLSNFVANRPSARKEAARA